MGTRDTIPEDDDDELERLQNMSKAEFFAAMVEGEYTQTSGKESAIVTTMRFRPMVVARLDVLAATLGKSRTYVVNEMIDVGWEAMMARMSPKTARKLNRSMVDLYQRHLEQARANPEEVE